MPLDLEAPLLVLIHWMEKGKDAFSVQGAFTVIWEDKSPEDVISKQILVQAKWYPKENYNKGHKGIHMCLILSSGSGKFILIRNCI